MYYQIPLRANHDNNMVFEPSEHQDEIYDELEDVLSNIEDNYQQTDELTNLLIKHPILGFPIMVFKAETDQLTPKFIGVYRGSQVKEIQKNRIFKTQMDNGCLLHSLNN